MYGELTSIGFLRKDWISSFRIINVSVRCSSLYFRNNLFRTFKLVYSSSFMRFVSCIVF